MDIYVGDIHTADEASPPAAVAEVEDQDSELKRRREQQYEVSEIVTAVYKDSGCWRRWTSSRMSQRKPM